jgi:hypothetical protein
MNIERLQQLVRVREFIWKQRLAAWLRKMAEAEQDWRCLRDERQPSCSASLAVWGRYSQARVQRWEAVQKDVARSHSGVVASRSGWSRAHGMRLAVDRLVARRRSLWVSMLERCSQRDVEAWASARRASRGERRRHEDKL